MEEEKHNSEDIENRQESEKTEKSIDNNPDKSDVSKIKEKVQNNPWMVVSVVLLVAVIVLLVINFRGGITGNVISEESAGLEAVDFVNSNLIPPGQEQVILNSVSEKSGLYEVMVNYQGRELPLYITKDGEFLIQSPIPMGGVTQPSQTQELDWSIFKNSLDPEILEKILSFTAEESKETSNQRVQEFESYQECKNKLIVFYHPDCIWCIRYYPVLEQAQKDYPELEIYTLDLSENRDIADKYSATGTPASVINCKYFVSEYMDKEVLYEILGEFNK